MIGRRRSDDQPGDHSWLVVGLGNPGPRYEGTRHNVGAMVVDELARRHGATLRSHKAGAAIARIHPQIGGPALVLARPTSYMNESGRPVGALVRYFHVPLERLVVLHDELDIDFDRLRVKHGGGDNGHNGLKSIRAHLGSGDYHRVRIGIGRPPGSRSPADFVLSPFTAQERELLPLHLDRAADAVESLVSDGLVATQTRFNVS